MRFSAGSPVEKREILWGVINVVSERTHWELFMTTEGFPKTFEIKNSIKLNFLTVHTFRCPLAGGFLRAVYAVPNSNSCCTCPFNRFEIQVLFVLNVPTQYHLPYNRTFLITIISFSNRFFKGSFKTKFHRDLHWLNKNKSTIFYTPEIMLKI